jgi:hypothetical protein
MATCRAPPGPTETCTPVSRGATVLVSPRLSPVMFLQMLIVEVEDGQSGRAELVQVFHGEDSRRRVRRTAAGVYAKPSRRIPATAVTSGPPDVHPAAHVPDPQQASRSPRRHSARWAHRALHANLDLHDCPVIDDRML